VRELIRSYYLAFSRHDVDAVVANFADIVDYQGEGLRNRPHIRTEAEAYSRRWDTLSFSVGDISVSRTGDNDFAASFSFSYTLTTRGSSPVTGLSLNKWMLHKEPQGQLRIVFQRETIQQFRQSPGDKRKAKP
jgi:ketosteroid isomerase-like protein